MPNKLGLNDPWPLWEECSPHTCLDRARAENIYWCLGDAYLHCGPGSLAEVGVFKGGIGRLLARLKCDLPVHLFDTFAGMPNQWAAEHHEGYFSSACYNDVSIGEVKQVLAGCENVTLHQGFFPLTAGDIPDEERFIFVHCDCDLFVSVQATLEVFWPKLLPGGYIVVDDWGRKECPGVIPACLDYFRSWPVIIDADPIEMCVANIQKPL